MPRTKQTLFIGYFETQKGYILYELSNKMFFLSTDVTKEDLQFEYIDKQYSQLLQGPFNT